MLLPLAAKDFTASHCPRSSCLLMPKICLSNTGQDLSTSYCPKSLCLSLPVTARLQKVTKRVESTNLYTSTNNTFVNEQNNWRKGKSCHPAV